jgi:hypothetical protein
MFDMCEYLYFIHLTTWVCLRVKDLGSQPCCSAVKVLLKHRDIDVKMLANDGDRRQVCTALHLAILEMPALKGSERRNGIQTLSFVESFLALLIDHDADCESVCGVCV